MNILTKNAKMLRNVITVRKNMKQIDVIRTKQKLFTNVSIVNKQSIKPKRVYVQ